MKTAAMTRCFPLYEDGDDDKMLVFATDEQLTLLLKSDTIYIDQVSGHNYTSPRRSTTTHVYALLPGRRLKKDS